MKIFVTVDAGGRVIEPYGEGVSPSIPDGAILLSDADSALITQADCLGDYLLVNGALQVDAAFVATRKFLIAVSAKNAEVDAAYNAAISVISSAYPATERDSWSKQEAEARAYVANNSAATPLLSALAGARGITIADLASRVITKADSYVIVAGALIGRRQARQDVIAAAVAANSLFALQAVVW
jgi:hypothetical protein